MIFTIIYNNKKTADRFNQQCSLCQNTVLYCRRSPDGKNLICFVGLADARFVNYLLKQYKPERSKYPRYLYIYLKNIKIQINYIWMYTMSMYTMSRYQVQ